MAISDFKSQEQLNKFLNTKITYDRWVVYSANLKRLGTMNHPHGCTTEELMAAARSRFAEPAPILEDSLAMIRDLDN